MTEKSDSPTPITTTPVTNIGGTTTRQQHRRNTAEQDAIEDGESSGNEPKRIIKEAFKGTVEKMEGNVFQLPEESKKANQFTLTIEALHNYATAIYDRPEDLRPLFETPSRAALIDEPPDLPPLSVDGVTRVTRDHRLYIDWKYDCESYNTRTAILNSNLHKLFAVVISQCSPSAKSKVEGTNGYSDANTTDNCLWLLTTLRNICHRFEHTENRFVALVNAKAALFSYRQSPTQSITEYFNTFKELLTVLESYGGTIHDPENAAPGSLEAYFLTLSIEERDAYMRDRYTATLFLRNSDNHRFDILKLELSNDFAKGRDEYPVTLTDAHQRLLSYKAPPTKMSPNTHRTYRSDRGRGGGRGGSPARGGGRTGKSFVQVELSLAQVQSHFHDGIPNHYVLLDSDSTVSIFCNPALLTDIHDVEEPLYLETNGGGYQVSTQMGTVKDIGPVWYNPNSIANILSLAQVRLVRRVTMDTDDLPAFHVHKLDGTGTTVFAEHESGLYLFDASKNATSTVANHSNAPIIAYSYLQTVADNKSKFTARQVAAADDARKLYRLLGRPGHTRFLTTLRENHILNCPITVDDARRAEQIYGQDIAFLKGKTTATPAKAHIFDYTPVALPPELLSLHPNVTLCFDNFFVLGLTFSLSTSRNIRYLSCHHLGERTNPLIKACIASDLSIYRNRGFNPIEIHADGEYNSLRNTFPGVRFTICSADDHVPEIERAIRTVKETIRATIHGMPYSRLPRVLVKELVTHAVRTLNMLPHPDGVSPTLSPATIVTGYPKTDYRTMTLEFGTYVQVYDGTSNDTKSRTLGAIATNPTGNSSGDYYFMSLATGQRIHRRSWTIIPISDSTISRVEAIAFNDNMPLVSVGHTLTEYDPDVIVDLAEYDRNYVPPTTPNPPSDHDLTSDAYTDDSDDDDDDIGHHPDFDDTIPPFTHTTPDDDVAEERTIGNTEVETIENEVETTEHETIENEERTEPAENDETIEIEERTETTANVDTIENEERIEPVENEERTKIQLQSSDITHIAEAIENVNINNIVIETVENEERDDIPIENAERTYATINHGRAGLRPKKVANYKHRYGFTQSTASNAATKAITKTWNILDSMPTPNDETNVFSPPQMQCIHKAIVGLMFTQMSAHKGIKKHGKSALDALRKEFEQFKALDVLEPLDAFKMTDTQKSEALRALSVIKEKRDGSIKGRTCADGSKQQGKFSKAETGSPTIANDALYLSIMIDAYENRNVATADIAGAYLHALMKQFISMRFVGWAVDLLCEVNPEYEKYVVYEGKVKVLYVRCNKAIYGCVVSGVLWYELFSETLEKHGFVTNPYDFCVANATIDGSQCTIGWFVDDTKISHVKASVVTKIINVLETRFGKMKVTRGNSHTFLGMNIKYLGDGTATIHMPSYISEAIVESGFDVTKKVSTPCANNLLYVDSTSPLLPHARAKSFHSIVAKLIYVGTRA